MSAAISKILIKLACDGDDATKYAENHLRPRHGLSIGSAAVLYEKICEEEACGR